MDEDFPAPAEVHGFPVLGGIDWLKTRPDVHVVVAVGNPLARKAIVVRINEIGNDYATLIHPKAWLGENVVLGPGAVICAGALITTDIHLGAHVHVNLGATIGHDSVFGDFVTVSPGVNVSGGVHLADGVELGSGAVIVPGVSIGEWSVVGANAVVLSKLPRCCTAVGVPAQVIKQHSENVAG